MTERIVLNNLKCKHPALEGTRSSLRCLDCGAWLTYDGDRLIEVEKRDVPMVRDGGTSDDLQTRISEIMDLCQTIIDMCDDEEEEDSTPSGGDE